MAETQPLLGHIEEHQRCISDLPLVDFDPNGDSENPMEWSKGYKLGVVSLLSFMAFMV
jgi:hypothetical protein